MAGPPVGRDQDHEGEWVGVSGEAFGRTSSQAIGLSLDEVERVFARANIFCQPYVRANRRAAIGGKEGEQKKTEVVDLR